MLFAIVFMIVFEFNIVLNINICHEYKITNFALSTFENDAQLERCVMRACVDSNSGDWGPFSTLISSIIGVLIFECG